MSIPNHSILPVSASDLPTLAQFLRSSKLQLAINRFLFKDWPNEAAQIANYTSAVESGFKDPDPSTDRLKVVDDKSGEIVAHLVLTRKRPSSTEASTDQEDEKQNVPNGVDPEVFTTVTKAVTKVDQEMEGIDHLKLIWIFVKPSSRKHGIGSQLMQVCFEKAKSEGVPLALCSEPTAYGFFLKQGLKDTKHVDIDLSKWAPAYCGFGVFRISGMIWSHWK